MGHYRVTKDGGELDTATSKGTADHAYGQMVVHVYIVKPHSLYKTVCLEDEHDYNVIKRENNILYKLGL